MRLVIGFCVCALWCRDWRFLRSREALRTPGQIRPPTRTKDFATLKDPLIALEGKMADADHEGSGLSLTRGYAGGYARNSALRDTPATAENIASADVSWRAGWWLGRRRH